MCLVTIMKMGCGMLVNVRFRNRRQPYAGATVQFTRASQLIFDGIAPYDEVFPFFNWLVAEVDFTRFKATGATIVVDDGGEIDAGDVWSFGGAH